MPVLIIRTTIGRSCPYTLKQISRFHTQWNRSVHSVNIETDESFWLTFKQISRSGARWSRSVFSMHSERDQSFRYTIKQLRLVHKHWNRWVLSLHTQTDVFFVHSEREQSFLNTLKQIVPFPTLWNVSGSTMCSVNNTMQPFLHTKRSLLFAQTNSVPTTHKQYSHFRTH